MNSSVAVPTPVNERIVVESESIVGTDGSTGPTAGRRAVQYGGGELAESVGSAHK